jgi:hypothetical protein
MKKFKLRFVSLKYFFNGNTITAVIKAEIPENFDVNRQKENGIQMWNCATFVGSIVSVGTATCSPKDEYDIEKGKKIARARAEANVYIEFKKYLKDWINTFDRMECELISARNKSEDYIQHQKDYIESLIDD